MCGRRARNTARNPDRLRGTLCPSPVRSESRNGRGRGTIHRERRKPKHHRRESRAEGKKYIFPSIAPVLFFRRICKTSIAFFRKMTAHKPRRGIFTAEGKRYTRKAVERHTEGAGRQFGAFAHVSCLIIFFICDFFKNCISAKLI